MMKKIISGDGIKKKLLEKFQPNENCDVSYETILTTLKLIATPDYQTKVMG